MEKLQKEPFTKKNCLLGLLFILIYFIVGYVPSIFYAFNKNLYNLGLIITYLILLLSGFLIFKNRLKRDFKHLKNNFRKYLGFIIKNQLIMFAIYIIVSFISFFILKENSSSANQQAIESLPMLLILFSALIYAPIVEELVFHASIRRIIKNDFLYIILSGLIFGLLHTLSEATFLETIIKGLPYITISTYLAYVYVKTENIYCPMIGHLLHNVLGVISILLLNV